MLRIALTALAGLALTACGPANQAAAPAPTPLSEPALVSDAPTEPMVATIPTYDQTWHVGDFWSGEYPDGFTVKGDGVTLIGRAEMLPGAPRNITCMLPDGANYTPWNVERAEADDLKFVSANKITKITITKDVELDSYDDDSPIKLSLKTGDELHYLYYIAEGFFMAEYQGQDYELLETDMNDSAKFETGGSTHEWVNVKCDDGDGTRAWLLLSEVQGSPGTARTEHDQYGAAHDLIVD